MELVCLLGCVWYCLGISMALLQVQIVGINLFLIGMGGLPCFHFLTCGERYLAVVHPVTYRGLREAGGVRLRLRNGSAACAWLACVVWIGLLVLYSPDFPLVFFCVYLVIVLLLTSFFSLSVLRVLSVVRPGEGGARERVDQSRRRAFHTVTAILATLLVKFVGVLGCIGVAISPLVSVRESCMASMAAFWFCLPSSLVLPGLYLHRAGTVPGCRG